MFRFAPVAVEVVCFLMGVMCLLISPRQEYVASLLLYSVRTYAVFATFNNLAELRVGSWALIEDPARHSLGDN